MIYDLTSKGQGQNLTSGQGHVIIELGHVAYQSMRLDETNTRKPFPTFYLCSIKSYWQKKLFVASNDLWWPFKRLLAKKRTLTIAAVPNHSDFKRFGLFLCVHMNLEAFSFFSIDLQWRGHGADLSSGHRYKKIRDKQARGTHAVM